MAAFRKAFPNGEDVRLKIKTLPDCLEHLSPDNDPRITIDTTPMLPAAAACPWPVNA